VIFGSPINWAHRAVVFAIAQLYCLTIILLPYSSNVVSVFIYCGCYGDKFSPVISYILYLFPWLLHIYCMHDQHGVCLHLSVRLVELMPSYAGRAYKCGISKDLFTFQDLLHDSGATLFRKMQSSMHCLNTLLPPKTL